MRRHREQDADGRELTELTALADGSLTPERRAALEARVSASSELADRLAEQQRAVALMRSAAEGVEAPADLRARIETGQRVRSVRMPRRPVFVGAAATALVVAAGLAVFWPSTSNQRFHAALTGTSVLPGAGGSATYTRTSAGWRIDLNAAGLPRLATGRFYEAWLRNDAGVLVPVGTFNQSGHVTLWAGVSPEHFTVLTVTRERADGDQTSSGDRVLVGTVDTGN
jgi:hypothetical protein